MNAYMLKNKNNLNWDQNLTKSIFENSALSSITLTLKIGQGCVNRPVRMGAAQWMLSSSTFKNVKYPKINYKLVLNTTLWSLHKASQRFKNICQMFFARPDYSTTPNLCSFPPAKECSGTRFNISDWRIWTSAWPWHHVTDRVTNWPWQTLHMPF